MGPLTGVTASAAISMLSKMACRPFVTVVLTNASIRHDIASPAALAMHGLSICAAALQRLRLRLRLPEMALHSPRPWPQSQLSASACRALPQHPLMLRQPLPATVAPPWPMPTLRQTLTVATGPPWPMPTHRPPQVLALAEPTSPYLTSPAHNETQNGRSMPCAQKRL